MTQPNPLPATLPAGTRSTHPTPLVSRSITQLSEGRYRGDWGDAGGGAVYNAVDPTQVDWGSVARPIQAGDWVEVVRATVDSKELIVGARHQVESTTINSFDGFRCTLFGVKTFAPGGWNLSRFKRVDGPHPEKTSAGSASSSRRASVGKYAGDDGGESDAPCSSVAPAVPDTGLLREAASLARNRCPDCGAPSVGYCAYCWHNTDGGERYAKEKAEMEYLVTRAEDAKGPTGKLLAGLEAEKPKPVACGKALAELAKVHPWECDE